MRKHFVISDYYNNNQLVIQLLKLNHIFFTCYYHVCVNIIKLNELYCVIIIIKLIDQNILSSFSSMLPYFCQQY